MQVDHDTVFSDYSRLARLYFRAWPRLMRLLHIRHYECGDSGLRYLITEPWDFAVSYAGKFKCRVFGRHALACRGRRDHFHTQDQLAE